MLRSLAEITGETVSLTVRIGWYGLRLAGVYGSRDIYHHDRLGEAAPLHQNLAGRGILAFLRDNERDRYRVFMETHHHDPEGPDWNSVEALLSRARETGFEHEELSSDGRAAIALPVRDPQGEVMASLAINGPVYLPATGDGQIEALAARDFLEGAVAASPAEFVSPFAGVAADEIVIRCALRERR
jgi:DNA-binding IclR family transcriptional regulator